LIDSLPTPSNINSFNPILSGKDTIQQLTTFLNFYAKKAAWDEGAMQKFLADEVFKLDSNVQPGNTNVDNGIFLYEQPRQCETDMERLSAPLIEKCGAQEWFEAGLLGKMALLEAGVAPHEDAIQPRGNGSSSYLTRLRLSTMAFKIMVFVICFIVAPGLGNIIYCLSLVQHVD
jgi:hypothetical protein